MMAVFRIFVPNSFYGFSGFAEDVTPHSFSMKAEDCKADTTWKTFWDTNILFWLIRSLVDPTLAVFIVCGPLQLVSLFSSRYLSRNGC